MPKLKTKSSTKRRFKVTANGKIKYKPAGKRHGMVKRSQKQIRNLRKVSVLGEAVTPKVKKIYALFLSANI